MTALEELLESIFQEFQSKRIIIVGMGREGMSTYLLLRTLFPELHLTLADKKMSSELDSTLQAYIAEDTFLDTQFGEHWLEGVPEFDLVIKTPGISQQKFPELKALRSSQVTSNTKLFFDVITHPRFRESFKVTTLGITGTKGKSTTTAMIHHLLKQAQLPTLLGGNIGVAPLDLIERITEFNPEDMVYIVLELSAHQLSDLTKSPNIAVVQNISPEHLDYYENFNEYVQAKSAIARWQALPNGSGLEDTVICNPSHTTALRIADLSRGEQCYFVVSEEQWEKLSEHKQSRVVASIKNDEIYQGEHKVMSTDKLLLKGEHNLENILPSVVIASTLNISPEITAAALQTFYGLPHRLEYVDTVHGVEFYNDSLATTPEAVQQALAAFPGKNIALIAGGYDRGLNYESLAESILKSSVKALLLFVSTGTFIFNLLKQKDTTFLENNYVEVLQGNPKEQAMAEAFTKLAPHLENIDIVLMSPGAASFNLFKDYADRGNQFKHQIKLLKEKLT